MIYPIQLISMALFASYSDEVIDAWDATGGTTYYCLECRAPLKLRRSKNRFPHFYHLQRSPSCRLYSKSERHLQIQLQIQKQLPKNESQIEKHFPQIHRIADLAWEKPKIVFEIQCSLISQNEAEERVSEYLSLGYEVVWVLDDRIFNKKQLRPAEAFMRRGPGYFVTGKGPFTLYDQLEIFRNLRRVRKGEQAPIDLSKKGTTPTLLPPTILAPLQITQRLTHSKYYFGNDLIEKTVRATPAFKKILESWQAAENKLPNITKSTSVFKKILENFVRKPYFALLNQLLKI